MNRVSLVSSLIRRARIEPYSPGQNDCFFLGLRIIDAVKGTAHVKAFSGSYKTLTGAHKALRKRGHKSVVALMSELLPVIPWGSATIGDLTVVEVDGVEHVGVHGGQAWHSITAAGPRSWPLNLAKAAFKV